ncbi:hypothetical protein M011DRAFT_466859 [Sporormia fimetaria CBS 119925]|uniref:Uncharacterized protein n=1 Tax=Sporormia fimetaria CBS 119925 TaxID=1340428 RepID=A0A6A6VD25_9PLEO|nr:hypothetical protein M011DRAFT_466859 [Sporormia fimetaria CBS 119925]
MLTPLRGQKPRKVSRESISRPIPDDRYPPELHVPAHVGGRAHSPEEEWNIRCGMHAVLRRSDTDTGCILVWARARILLRFQPSSISTWYKVDRWEVRICLASAMPRLQVLAPQSHSCSEDYSRGEVA